MDLYRFYVAAFTPPAVGLPEDQAHHATRVLRLETGASVIVFDGRGHWAQGVLRCEKRGTFVDIEQVHSDPPPALQVTLATAVPKADRAEWLVEQASQLGVSEIQWLDSDRAVVKPRESGGKMDKYRRVALEAAKQCGRTHLLAIAPMRTLEETLAGGAAVLCLDPRAEKSFGEVAWPQSGRVRALIGPEGGWSPPEVELLTRHPGIVRVRLNTHILRIETACAAVASLLLGR